MELYQDHIWNTTKVFNMWKDNKNIEYKLVWKAYIQVESNFTIKARELHQFLTYKYRWDKTNSKPNIANYHIVQYIIYIDHISKHNITRLIKQ